LLLLVREESAQTQVMMGFRLRDSIWSTGEARSPVRGLHVLVRECGIPTTLGGVTALLHTDAIVDDFAVEAHGGCDRGLVHAVVRRLADGRFQASCVFAIDQRRYEEAMRPRS
jgi:hypothetical protein